MVFCSRWLRAFAGLILALAVVQAQVPPNRGTSNSLSDEPPRGEITGSVVSARTGEVLRGTRILLQESQRGEQTEPIETVALTGLDGRFHFSDLRPGSYMLWFSKSGYEARRPVTRSISLPENDSAINLVVMLRRSAVVAGQVVDEEGDPVPGVRVRAYQKLFRFGRWNRGGGRSSATTNDLGEYRIFGLAAGRYLIGATPDAHSRRGLLEFDHAATFYPNAVSASEASWLKLNWGDEQVGADFQLIGGLSTVTGVVIDGATGGACARCSVWLSRVAGDLFERRGAIRPRENGSFAIQGLSPGRYKIRAAIDEGDWLFADQDVEIVDSDVQGLELVALPGQSVAGSVVLDEPPPGDSGGQGGQGPLKVNFWPRYPFPNTDYRGAPVPTDGGTFELDGLAPGPYRVGVIGSLGNGYLKTVYVSGQALPGPEVTVTPYTGISDLEIRIARDGATLDVHVKAGRGGASEATRGVVALVPDNSESGYRGTKFRRFQGNGRFQIPAIPPGSYTLYAFPGEENRDFQDLAIRRALQSFGKRVRLAPRESDSVELVLIPEEALSL